MESGLRIDKWLWAVRLFKTRSIAVDACKRGRIQVNGQVAKAAKIIKTGDRVAVHHQAIVREYKVLKLVPNRQPASRVPDLLEEITAVEELEKLKMAKLNSFAWRERGAGRPTKRQRRDISKLKDHDFWE